MRIAEHVGCTLRDVVQMHELEYCVWLARLTELAEAAVENNPEPKAQTAEDIVEFFERE